VEWGADRIMAAKLPDGFTLRNIDRAKWSGERPSRMRSHDLRIAAGSGRLTEDRLSNDGALQRFCVS
jgi:hypothetical protein